MFSKGNQLVYELDYATRQLRMIKDNVFEMERNLTEQIKVNYDRELDQTRMQLDETRRKFADFQLNINARVMADVRDNINSIDSIMKGKAALFKDLSRQGPPSTTINKGVSDSELNYYERVMREFETLKESEREAREEIIQLQLLMRKMRMVFRFKEVVARQQFEHKMDNMRQQLNSNTLLWEQLAEGEKREKILKRELEGSQQEIVTQEKIIEQLRDELKKERGEKNKLQQYRQTKSKRLEELESKAREFEVLQNLNLPKMLNLLEQKEGKIQYLKTRDNVQEAQLTQFHKQKEQEMRSLTDKYRTEIKLKSEAMAKMESLRCELQLIEGQDTGAVELWKDKCKKLIDICKSFKEENERLSFMAGGMEETEGVSGGDNSTRFK